jgi:hypothetical protein
MTGLLDSSVAKLLRCASATTSRPRAARERHCVALIPAAETIYEESKYRMRQFEYSGNL